MHFEEFIRFYFQKTTHNFKKCIAGIIKKSKTKDCSWKNENLHFF